MLRPAGPQDIAASESIGLRHQIIEAPRCGHNEVDALIQRLHLSGGFRGLGCGVQNNSYRDLPVPSLDCKFAFMFRVLICDLAGRGLP